MIIKLGFFSSEKENRNHLNIQNLFYTSGSSWPKSGHLTRLRSLFYICKLYRLWNTGNFSEEDTLYRIEIVSWDRWSKSVNVGKAGRHFVTSVNEQERFLLEADFSLWSFHLLHFFSLKPHFAIWSLQIIKKTLKFDRFNRWRYYSKFLKLNILLHKVFRKLLYRSLLVFTNWSFLFFYSSFSLVNMIRLNFFDAGL